MKGSSKKSTQEEETPCTSVEKYGVIPSRDESYAPTEVVHGYTYGDLALASLKWNFNNYPSPGMDSDGSLNEMDSGIEGVHFLASNMGGTTFRRTKISDEDVVFFPIIVGLTIMPPDKEEYDFVFEMARYTERFLGLKDLTREQLATALSAVSLLGSEILEMNVTLDGCRINARHDYITTNDLFELSYPQMFGLEEARLSGGGFWIAFGPLPQGTHTLKAKVKQSGINYATHPGYWSDEEGNLIPFEIDLAYELVVEKSNEN